ncbi:hypothetical protein Syun_026214 [Stephania yunnanensis]|uniref:pectinesterase n=1 Tax=Stephania yunnanensis TaxID=152371 RepID=A0AAP0ETJ5_9MAGN
MASSSLRVVSIFMLCFALFLATAEAQLSPNATNNATRDYRYITWQDLDFGIEATRDTDGQGTRVIYVAKNGHGHSTTVQGAVDMVPENNNERVKIVIFAGTYNERVYIPSNKPYISFIGNPNYPTVITNSTKASDVDPRDPRRELGTSRTATVEVEGDYFAATGITIQNTVVANGQLGAQAVALRLAGENAFLYNTRILGSQDTLLDDRGKHYFYKCYIEGLVDFICGEAQSLFQDCVLNSTAKSSGGIAAHHREKNDSTGFSFVNCTITGTGSIYLGRAWGPYSRTVYSHCHIDGIINPVGWSDWNQPERQKTVFFAEAQNRGRGSWSRRRVPYAKRLNPSQAQPFLDINFVDGEQWLRLDENTSPQFNCLCC